MTKSKSKFLNGTVTLTSAIFFFLLVSFLMNLRVVLILRVPPSDLMRPPLDHIKHVELEKCCGRISNVVGVITLENNFNGVGR